MSHASIPQLYAKDGEEFTLKVATKEVKFLTRRLETGNQNWYLEGANKDSWVDESGKKLDSSNYTLQAPGTIIFKKITESDSGFYTYEPRNPAPTSSGPQVLGSTRGIRLIVLKKI